MIKAEIVADSIDKRGNRLTSLLLTFPRIILAELNTHRMLSKNTASSRAIPFNKMVQSVQENPFIPIAWQSHHSGMQGSKYITEEKYINHRIGTWITASRDSIKWAKELYGNINKYTSVEVYEAIEDTGVTKQLCNRLLEPYMWVTALVTGSKEGWDNFFELRCPQYEYSEIGKDKIYFKSKKDWLVKANNPEEYSLENINWFGINKGQAEIHIMDLAEKIYDEMNENTPKLLNDGEWHIPFEDKLDNKKISETWRKLIKEPEDYNIKTKVEISTAMAARTSYTVVGDEKEIDYKRMIEIHDMLISAEPLHASPLEHCAKAMSDEEYHSCMRGMGINNFDEEADCIYPEDNQIGWLRNYRGFIQYRHILENDKNNKIL